MEYVKLGRTGLKVSRLCLGTAFRGYWHGQNDKATAKKTIFQSILWTTNNNCRYKKIHFPPGKVNTFN